WSWCGEWTPLVPQGMALAFALGTAGTLHAALRERRGWPLAALGLAMLVGTPFFTSWSAAQDADVPLCCFVLVTLVLLERGAGAGDGVATLAGLAAACAAWTKN